MSLLKFIKTKKAIKHKKKEYIEAFKTLIFPAGIGLFFVLSTSLSIFLSVISFTIHPADRIRTDPDRNKKEYVREFSKHIRNLENILLFQNGIVAAKMMIVNKLNSVRQLTDTFIKTAKGYKVVNPEGYVAIDKSGKAVKLVDRMEFSYNNFTAIKNWDK